MGNTGRKQKTGRGSFKKTNFIRFRNKIKRTASEKILNKFYLVFGFFFTYFQLVQIIKTEKIFKIKKLRYSYRSKDKTLNANDFNLEKVYCLVN